MGTGKKKGAYARKNTSLTLLNRARLNKGYTVAEVAMAIGAKSGSAIAPWLTGNAKVPAKYAEQVAQLLDIDVNDLTLTDGHRGAPKGRPITPLAYTTTFWNKKRVESNRTISEVAEIIGTKRSTTGKYFVGMLVPDDDTIKRFCDLFDVEFMRGRGEFVRANKVYKAIHKRQVTCKGTLRKADTTAEDAVAPASEHTPEPVQEKPVLVSKAQSDGIKKKEALTSLYGKVTYDEFTRLFGIINAGNSDDIVASVYGTVDFDTFIKVKSILE